MLPFDKHYKTLQSSSLDHDQTAEMRSTPKHLSRYNAINNATCVLIEPVVRDHANARDPALRPIQRSACVHVTCMVSRVWVSPTREIISETVVFIRPDGL